MDHSIINKLERQIIDLTDAFQKLREENQALRARQAALYQERCQLEALNHQAAEKLKQVVHKIKKMGQ